MHKDIDSDIVRNTDQRISFIGEYMIRLADNKGASLDDAIRCWKYKKSLKGQNKYKRSDLKVLEQ